MTDAPSSRFRIWLLAIRPATLPASVSGVIVGLGVARAGGTALRWDVALGCLAVALLLQVAANLANDLSDFRRGADTPDRMGPTRVAAAGLVTVPQLEVAIGAVLAAAAVAGSWLTLIGGPAFLVVGLAAMVAALAYTGGPFAYGYHGLGELFVFTFFGLVAVAGTAALQSGRLDTLYLVTAIPIGTLTTAILVVNNLRDISTDRAAGKRTLAVVFGAGFAKAEYAVCLVIAGAVPVALTAARWRASSDIAVLATLLPLLAIPLAVPLWRAVAADGDPRRLNLVLRGTGRLTLAFAVLFGLGLAFGRA